ncbi:MAG: S41 family peptidase [bacterium]|nr:S41 family peptidase [bacterium]
MRNTFRSLLIVFITSFISVTGMAQNNGFEVIRSLEIMNEIYENLEKYYVDDLNSGSMSKAAIDAMLKDLDPYTVYYHETEIEDYQLMTTGQYGGIGALIRKVDDYTYITEPYEGKPAQVAGLRAGDKIISIDGKDMKDKPSSEVSTALKGPKGKELEIEVERPNGDTKKFKFTRDEIKLPDVPYSGLMDNNVGYIKLNSFTRTAHQEVLGAYTDLKAEGMEKLILDLRGNGGGLLIEAVKIVNMFIPKNEVVVTTKARVAEENRKYTTMSNPVDLDIPVIVLIDEGSASASEIVAGSLQDYDRAVIVGTTSFGKGLVQRTYDLSYGSKMKLTIAKYYTPSGRCVQRLEYYDRAEGDRPEEVPDSLLQIFHTKNGREVIDGRGIEPDADVEPNEFSRLTAVLYGQNFVFDFATDYYYRNLENAPSEDFDLPEAEYKKFKEYVLEQDFTYSTASEERLKKMKETAEEEGFYEDMKDEYDALLKKVVPSKERDLEKFKKEIMQLIENDIVSRYHYQRGRSIHAFKDDVFMQRAMEIFKSSDEYNTILGN